MAIIRFFTLALAASSMLTASARLEVRETSKICVQKCGNSASKCYTDCMGLTNSESSGVSDIGASTTFSMSSFETMVPVSTGSTTIDTPFRVVQMFVPKEVASSTSSETTTTTSSGTEAVTLFSTSGTSLIPTATSTILHSSEITMATAVATHPVTDGGFRAAVGSASVVSVMLSAWLMALLR